VQTRTMSPGALERELIARLAAPGPARRPQRADRPIAGRARGRLAAIFGVALALGAAGASSVMALVSDTGTYSVEVANKTLYAVADVGAAHVEYIGDSNISFGASGTGTFDSFVRLQASPTEAGYNTNGTLEFDTKSGTWTHAIKVSDIPVVNAFGAPSWELWADINDSNSAPKISLNELEVYFADSATVTGYPTFGGHASKVYDFSGHININDVNQGSGRGDLRYTIPVADMGIPANCGYKNPACTTWFVLYSQWGAAAGTTYASDGGFEEWKVKQYPYVTVAKTATPAFTRTYAWTIDKSVDDTEIDIAEGGTATFNYTVQVQHNAGTDSGYGVSGTITINNPGTLDAVITSVTDQISGGINATVSCGVTFPYTLVHGGTLSCTYTASLPDGASRTNTATVTLTEGTVFTGTAAVTFGSPSSVVDECVNVTDTYAGTLGTACVGDANPKSFTYSRTVSGVAGTCTDYDNTATFTTNDTATTGSDDQTVTVCVGKDLTVTKNATPTFTRTYDWDITKDVDATTATIDLGGSATFNYTVNVSHDAGTNSGWALTGTITVNNPNDWEAIVVDITDAVDNGGVCTVTNGDDVSVPASGSVQRTYSCTYASAPSPASGTNTATATWDAALYHTPTGSDTGTAAANFSGAPTTVVDECIDVTDSVAGFLGTVCVGDANPTTFHYSRTIAPVDYGNVCGTYTFDNTASFETNDTAGTGSDSETVTVIVLCPSEGCTPGYWKNHIDAWVGYTTGQTVESVFDVPDVFGLDNDTLLTALAYQGGTGDVGAAKILLRAGVAALLNAANSSIDYPLTTAQVIALVNAALAGSSSDMLTLATTLDGYNNLVCPLN
jgi:hypothetical protein